MNNLIETENLIKKYGDFFALKGISFSVKQAEIFGIIGPNGAGKTSTIEIMEGIKKPSGGKVRVFGESPYNNKKLKSKINVQLQGITFFSELRVIDIFKMYAVLYDSKAAMYPLIENFGMEDKLREKYKNLSGGQKQKLSLAIAFINEPKILFLDEPTVGLDPISRNQVWKKIKEHHRKGNTILITSHYMEEIERLCDRVIFINKGKIVESGSVDEILSRHSEAEVFEVEFSDGVDIEDLKPFFKNTKIKGKDNKFVLFSKEEDMMLTLSRISEKLKIKVTNYKMQKSKLEDIYVKLLGD